MATFMSAFTAWVKQHQDNLPFIKQTLDQPHVFPHGGGIATPLEFAALTDHIELVHAFLGAGANPDGKNNDGMPLEFASSRKHESIVDALCKHKVVVGINALKLAIENGSLGIVQKLLNRLHEENKQHADAGTMLDVNLIEAGLYVVLHNKSGQRMLALFMLYALKQPNPNYAWMLEASIEYDCVPLLMELIKRNVDLHALRTLETEAGHVIALSMFELACKHKRYHITELLLKNGFNVNFSFDGLRIIHRCIAFPMAIDALITLGAEVNYVQGDLYSPVLMAVISGDKTVLAKLLAAGANPNGAIQDPDHPIAVIPQTKNFNAISKLLLSHQAFDVETLFATDKTDEFPLCKLLRYGGVNLLKFILMLPRMADLKDKTIFCGLIFGLFNEMHVLTNEIVRYYKENYGLEVAIVTVANLLQQVEATNGELSDRKGLVVDGLKAISERLSKEFAAQSETNGLTYLSGEIHRPQAARAYMAFAHGWKRANFDSQLAVLKENKKKLAQSDNDIVKEVNMPSHKATWFGGRLNESMFDEIEKSQTGVRYFMCIPGEPRDADSDCSHSLELFRKKSRFCFGETVKDISDMQLKASIKIFGVTYKEIALNHEVKLKCTKDRLLCADFISDDGQTILQLVVKFSKDGAHTNGQVKDLQAMPKDAVFEIDLSSVIASNKSIMPTPQS